MGENTNLKERKSDYFRRKDTLLAKALSKASPSIGEEYRGNDLKLKFVRDAALTLPPAIIALPVIGALALVKRIEDGGSPFYLHERIDQNGKHFNVVKIRTMRPDSDKQFEREKIEHLEPAKDPRSTRLGRFIRKMELDELPQLCQVVSGKLSLVGIRPVGEGDISYLQKKLSRVSFREWVDVYFSAKPALFNLHSAISTLSRQKDILDRVKSDKFYAQHASLGLDLYIIYRMTKKLFKGVLPRNKVPKRSTFSEPHTATT